MAIRGQGYWGHTSGSYFADETLEGYGQGTALILKDPATASGKPGDANNLVVPSQGAAGEKFVGILRSTVYNWDKTRQCFHPMKYQSAATACTPVNTMQKGEVLLESQHFTLGGTPAAEDALFLGPSGTFSDAGLVEVGKFTGAPNTDGSIAIRIDV